MLHGTTFSRNESGWTTPVVGHNFRGLSENIPHDTTSVNVILVNS